MRYGTMGTTSPRLSGKELGGGGATMSRPTWPKDTSSVTHNRGELEDRYKIKSYK
jgi:hypothetical protein